MRRKVDPKSKIYTGRVKTRKWKNKQPVSRDRICKDCEERQKPDLARQHLRNVDCL